MKWYPSQRRGCVVVGRFFCMMGERRGRDSGWAREWRHRRAHGLTGGLWLETRCGMLESVVRLRQIVGVGMGLDKRLGMGQGLGPELGLRLRLRTGLRLRLRQGRAEGCAGRLIRRWRAGRSGRAARVAHGSAHGWGEVEGEVPGTECWCGFEDGKTEICSREGAGARNYGSTRR